MTLLTSNPDEVLNKHWLDQDSVQVGSLIATGGYGRVYEGKYGTLNVAIKDYGIIYDRLNNEDKLDIMQEFSLMKDLNHTNTVRVYGFILHQRCLALVMELAKGALRDCIENDSFRKDVKLQYHVLLQISLAMRFIHSQNIIHRDLKPDNVLVFQDKTSSCVIKIADFGESRRIGSLDRSLTYGKGTFTYMDKAAVYQGNNKATDYFSFCMLAYEVLSGEFIPRIANLDSLIKRPSLVIPLSVPKALRDCLMSGFDEEQAKRATWTDTIIALQDAIDMTDGPKRGRRFFLPIHNTTDFLQPITPVPVDLTKHTRNGNCFQIRRHMGIIAATMFILVLIGITIPLAIIFLNADTTAMPSKPFTKLFVASGTTGESWDVILATSEIIDLANSSTKCKAWFQLAIPVRGAVGGFVDDGVLICGGSTDAKNPLLLTNQCQHIKPLQSVITSTNISHASFASSSIVYDNSLFITGGYNPHVSTNYNTSEYVSLTTHQSGPTLPYGVADHCMIYLDDDIILFTGGILKENSTSLRHTWYFSINDKSWTPGPEMNEPRNWHACSYFVLNNTVYPIVAGSESNSTTRKSVEILDLSLESPKWIPGPELDFLHSDVFTVGHHLVTNGEALFYISTTDNLFFRLECETIQDCKWIQLLRELENIRIAAIVALVPDTLTDCS